MAAVNYMLSSFEGNINPGYPLGLKFYLQETNEIDKEADKIFQFPMSKTLYITFSV